MHGNREHTFFRAMGVILTLVVIMGFGPTYYWRFLTGAPAMTTAGGPFSPVIEVHAAIFTAWLAVFNVQAFLISSGRRGTHQRLGVAGTMLAAAMVLSGVIAAIDMAARGLAPAHVPPAVFVATPLFSIALFAIFVSIAWLKRRDRQSHKRWMLQAFIVLTGPALARILLGFRSLGPAGAVAGPFLPLVFVFVGMMFDRASRQSVHPAYLWGAVGIAGASVLRMAVAPTAAWRGFIETLIAWPVW
jgi:FtsH-binding integral membrane protein